MANFTRLVPLSSIRLVPVIGSTNPLHNLKHFDKALFLDQIQQDNVRLLPYAQPVKKGDKLTVYIDSTGVSLKLELFSVTAGAVWNGTLTPNITQPGNTINSEQLNTFYTQLGTGSLTEGYYYVEATITYSDSTTDAYTSELLDVRVEQPGTIYVECTQNKNDHDVLFEQTSAVFRHRFYANLAYMPGGKATVFNGFKNVANTLKADSWRNFTLTVGDKEGIPDWVVDKLTWIYKCRTILLDGKRFGREPGKDLAMRPIGEGPLNTATLELREYKHDNYVFENNTSLLFTIGTYPSAFAALMMGSTNIQFDSQTPAVWFDQADLEAYKSALNANIGNTVLEGTFTRVGDSLYYVNAPGESFVYNGFALTSTYLKVKITMPSSGLWRFFFISGLWNIVSWGDNGVSRAFGQIQSNTSVLHEHPYAASGNYDIYIFHYPGMKGFICNSSQFANKIKEISGVLPENCEQFDVRGGGAMALTSTTLDPSFAFPARFKLKVFIFSGTNMVNMSPGLFSQGTVQNGSWGQLIYFDMRVNRLNVTTIDQLFNQRQQITLPVAGAAYLVNLQNPAAAPTNASLTARQILQVGYGCSITTD